MKMTGNGGLSYKEELDAILNSDLPDTEKLAAAFGGLTHFTVEVAQKEIELSEAMDDRQEMIKQQIKMETIKWVREMFQTIFWQVTGKRAWDEPVKR